ncbi:hypothetical protein JY651_47845 [Pyxidicoccus parkwayensis]|uniref:Uncharacterized protein n=1 Tax=Pyxidicoccus parkwayensis TaxID=2813578 RepID=A0ABX7P1V0_9BACT|nr:hypothetical protein [Pyxidicoccus parkwaysis]QSQ22733.1 hypothetical protein JY651_47845 [Pyxidicoccus parkwaysis]
MAKKTSTKKKTPTKKTSTKKSSKTAATPVASFTDNQSTGYAAPYLARAFSALMDDQFNPMSESDDVFTPFSADLAATEPINADTLRAALGIGSRYRLDLESGDFFFDRAPDDAPGPYSVFMLLQGMMEAVLTDLTLLFVRGEGVVRVRTFLFGRLPDGTLVGLRTTTTET